MSTYDDLVSSDNPTLLRENEMPDSDSSNVKSDNFFASNPNASRFIYWFCIFAIIVVIVLTMAALLKVNGVSNSFNEPWPSEMDSTFWMLMGIYAVVAFASGFFAAKTYDYKF